MAGNIMDSLREDTMSLHKQTEGNDFQTSLFSGNVPKKQFVDYLGQMYLIHKALEDALSELRNRNSIVATVIGDHQYQQNYLKDDLATAKVDAQELQPLPATKKLINHMNQLKDEQPMALLGCEYVLFGSKHGAKMLTKRLEKYELWQPGAPNYFDPYGDKFAGYWQDFKAKMNAAQFTQPEQEQIIQGAKDMFSILAEVFDDLLVTS
jgi:heme oxygenase